jgi:L-histidine Nalpha-methyltransferase
MDREHTRGARLSAELSDSDARDRFTLVETPIRESFADAVAKGFGDRPRHIPPRYFYDAEGSRLFDRITELPEYYVTRTEIEILTAHAREFPSADVVIEFGGGSGEKSRLLFDAWCRTRPRIRYVPVDISRAALLASAETLLPTYPTLSVDAIRAEFDRALELLPSGPALVLFLGSNIGNFDEDEAVRFLSALRGRQLLIGFDMEKSVDVLHTAYNDADGVTAAFNLNVLARINRELGGTFDLSAWRHLAFYDPALSRIEMHLVATRRQDVRVAALDRTFAFDAGERIHTENSYKFSPRRIETLARAAGLAIVERWTDEREWFSVVLLS